MADKHGALRISRADGTLFNNEAAGDLVMFAESNMQRILIGNNIEGSTSNAMVTVTSNSTDVAGTVNAEDVSTYQVQTTDIYITTYDPRNSNTLQVIEPYYQADTFTLNLASYASNAANYASNVANTVDPAVGQFASNTVVSVSNFLTPKTVYASNTSTWASNNAGGGAALVFASNAGSFGSNSGAFGSNLASSVNGWATIYSGSNLGFNYATTLLGTTMTTGSILPTTDSTVDLGSATKRFRSLYVSGNTIYIGSNALSSETNGTLTIINQQTSEPAKIVVQEVRVGASDNSNAVIIRADSNTGAVQFVSASVSNGIITEASNASTTTFDSNLPLQAVFGSNSGAFSSNLSVYSSNLTTRIDQTSNLSYANSNNLYPAATFASNTAAWTSNNAGNSGTSTFASNTASWASNAFKNPSVSNIIISGDIIPTQNHVQNIGTSNNRFNVAYIDTLYIASNTLYVGGVPVLSTKDSAIVVSADPDQSINIKTTGTGQTLLSSSNGVQMTCSGLNGVVSLSSSGIGGTVNIGAATTVGLSGSAVNITSAQTTVSGALTAGSLTVTGTATFNGSNFIANAQTMEVLDNIILVNRGQIGNGVSAGQAGLRVDRGDLMDQLMVYDETVGAFVMGPVGSTSTIATQPFVTATALVKSSNLSDVTNVTTAVNNLGLGASCNVTFNQLTATSYTGLVTGVASTSTTVPAAGLAVKTAADIATFASNLKAQIDVTSNTAYGYSTPTNFVASNATFSNLRVSVGPATLTSATVSTTLVASNANLSNIGIGLASPIVPLQFGMISLGPRMSLHGNDIGGAYTAGGANISGFGVSSFAVDILTPSTGHAMRTWLSNANVMSMTSNGLGVTQQSAITSGVFNPVTALDVVGATSVPSTVIQGGHGNLIACFRAANGSFGVNDAGVAIGSVNGNAPYISSTYNTLSLKASNVQVLSLNTNGTANFSGALGVGTSNPIAPLHITPGSSISPAANGVYVYNPTNTSGNHAIVTTRVAGTSSGNPYYSMDVAGTAGWSMGIDTADSLKLKFFRNWDFAGSVSMTMDRSGNIGIGTTSPAYPLHVTTATAPTTLRYVYITSNQASIGGPTTGTGFGAQGYSAFFTYSVAMQELNVISDARVKTEVAPIQDIDIEKFMALQPVTYKYIDERQGNQTKHGFIAQEVEATLPGAVKQITNQIPDVFMSAKVRSVISPDQDDEVEVEVELTAPSSTVLAPGDKLVIYTAKSNDSKDSDEKHEVLVVRQIDDTRILLKVQSSQTKDKVSAFSIPGNSVFVYGRMVDDFRVLDTDQIVSIAVHAIQHLDRKYTDKLKAVDERLEEMEARFRTLI